jgi:PDZ domain
LAAALIVGASTTTSAQDTASPEKRPLLEELTRETQLLHREVRRSVLRVQLPPPRWLDEGAAREADNPLNKYKGLDPTVRRQLEQRTRRAASTEGEALARSDENSPSAPLASDAETQVRGNAAFIVIPPPAPQSVSTTAPAFAPNSVGIVLDEQGHLLVPLYLERESAAEQTLRVSGPDGKLTEARFIGSDRQTNLTVLKMTQPAGEPVRLREEERPADGSLILLVTPHDGAGKLGLWTGEGRDYALTFSIDGRCAGVARFGQFLSGRACKLIASQIIRHGAVKRATLGVIVTQLPKAEGLQSSAVTPAAWMRVDQVIAGAPADKAGICTGDFIVALAGQPVADIPSLAAAIAARSGPTEIALVRDGQTLTVTVELQQK